MGHRNSDPEWLVHQREQRAYRPIPDNDMPEMTDGFSNSVGKNTNRGMDKSSGITPEERRFYESVIRHGKGIISALEEWLKHRLNGS